MGLRPGRIAFCGAKPRKCPFRVWGTRCQTTQSRSFFLCATCSPEKLRLVRLALLAHPRLHFGHKLMRQDRYSCAHRDAENARTEKLFVMRLHELRNFRSFCRMTRRSLTCRSALLLVLPKQGRSPVISFLRCQQAKVCSFVLLLQRCCILRFAAAKKLGAGLARASQQPFRSQALRARHLLRGSSVCAILGSRSFGRISAGEQSLHASSVACSPMCRRIELSSLGSVLKFEKAAEGNQQLDRCEPQERRGASPDHSASSKVHSGFVCHGRCGDAELAGQCVVAASLADIGRAGSSDARDWRLARKQRAPKRRAKAVAARNAAGYAPASLEVFEMYQRMLPEDERCEAEPLAAEDSGRSGFASSGSSCVAESVCVRWG